MFRRLQRRLLPSTSTLALLGAGFASALVFAPWDIWPLVFLCVGVLFYLLRQNTSLLHAAMQGTLFAWVFNLANLWWVTSAFILHAPVPEVKTAAYPAVIIMSFILALPYGVMAAFFTGIHKKIQLPAALSALIFALLWTGVEVLRGSTIYGFPWNLLGYSLSPSLEMLQLASVTTVFGLSFMVALCSALLATLQIRHILAAALLLAGVWGYGAYRLHTAPAPITAGHMFMVQTTIPQPEKWDEALRAFSIQKYLDLSSMAEPGDVIVWPETALTYDITTNPIMREQVHQFLPYRTSLVTGHPRYTETDNSYMNSITLLRQDGTLGDTYDKHLLVPFGEFVPLRHHLGFLGEFATATFDYTAGHTPPRLNLENGRVALPLICYEAIFPLFVKRHVTGTNMLLNITNDAWFATTHAPLQHFAIARLRAIETGTPLVRLANSGISAVVDGYGRISSFMKMNESRGMRVSIPAGLDK